MIGCDLPLRQWLEENPIDPTRVVATRRASVRFVGTSSEAPYPRLGLSTLIRCRSGCCVNV